MIGLEDTEDMEIKLWASWADDNLFEVKKTYIFRNIEVDRWKGHLSVSSTDETIYLYLYLYLYVDGLEGTGLNCPHLYSNNSPVAVTSPVSYTHLTLPTNREV